MRNITRLLTGIAFTLLLFGCQKNSSPVNYDLIPICQDDLYGYISPKGDWVIKPKYAYVSAFVDGLAFAKKESDGLYGFIDTDGKWVIKPKYKYATFFTDGIAFVVDDNNTIIAIDKKDKELFKLKKAKTVINYDSNGQAWFRNNDGLWGTVDKKGEIVIKPKYEKIIEVNNGFAIVKKNDSYRVINDRDEIVYKTKNGSISGLSEGIFWVKKSDDKHVAMNTEGNELFSVRADGIYGFRNGTAIIYRDSKYGLIDKEGEIIIRPKYSDMTIFSNTNDDLVFAQEEDDGYGLINRDGDWVIKPKYDQAYPFMKNGLAMVVVDDLIGFINRDGEYAIKPKFEFTYSTLDAMASLIYDLYLIMCRVDESSVYNYEEASEAAEEEATSEDDYYWVDSVAVAEVAAAELWDAPEVEASRRGGSLEAW
ncbi:MAG: WG repeat-containing protein [Paludibacteraceae bacterium]|nr:WG repeat-containing protein [Paludibacteraceae bacterium]